MGGSLLQLVATGIPDLYLTGDPQITWFKILYRRYEEFAMADCPIRLDGDLQLGGTHYIKIPPIADKLNKVSLVVDVPAPVLKMQDPTVTNIANLVSKYGLESPVYSPPKKPNDIVKYEDLFNDDETSFGSTLVKNAKELNVRYNTRLDILQYTLNTYAVDKSIFLGRYIAVKPTGIDFNIFEESSTVDKQGYLILTYEKTQELLSTPDLIIDFDEESFVYRINSLASRFTSPIDNTNPSTTFITTDKLAKIYPRAVNGFIPIKQQSDLANLDPNTKYHIILSIDHLRKVKERNNYLRYLYQNVDSVDENSQYFRQTEANIEQHRKLLFTNFSYTEMLDNTQFETGVFDFQIDAVLEDEYYEQLEQLLNTMRLQAELIDFDLNAIDSDQNLLIERFNRFDINENALFDKDADVNQMTDALVSNENTRYWLIDIDTILKNPILQDVLELVQDGEDIRILINPKYVHCVQSLLGFAPFSINHEWESSITRNLLLSNPQDPQNPIVFTQKVPNMLDGVVTLARIFRDFYLIPSLANSSNIAVNSPIRTEDVANLHNMLLRIYDDTVDMRTDSRNYKLDDIKLYNTIEIKALMQNKLIKDIIYVDQKKLATNMPFTMSKYYRHTVRNIFNQIVSDVYEENLQYTDPNDNSLNAQMVYSRNLVYNNSKYLMWSYYFEHVYFKYVVNTDNFYDVEKDIEYLSYLLLYLALDPSTVVPTSPIGTAIEDPTTKNVRFSTNDRESVTDIMIYDDTSIIENYDRIHRATDPQPSSIFEETYIYAGERFGDILTENEQTFMDDQEFTYPDGYRTCINREVEFYHVISTLDHSGFSIDDTVYNHFIELISISYSDPRNYVYTVSFRTTEKYLSTYFKDVKILNSALSLEKIGLEILVLIVKTVNTILVNYSKLLFRIWKNSTYSDQETTPQVRTRLFIGLMFHDTRINYDSNYVRNELTRLRNEGLITDEQLQLGDPTKLRAKFFAGTDVTMRPIMGWSNKFQIYLNDPLSYERKDFIINSQFVDTVKLFIDDLKSEDSLTLHIDAQIQQVKTDMDRLTKSTDSVIKGTNYIYWRDMNSFMKLVCDDINFDYGLPANDEVVYYPNTAIMNHMPLMLTYYYGQYMQYIVGTNMFSTVLDIDISQDIIFNTNKYELYPVETEDEINKNYKFDVEPESPAESMIRFLGTDVRTDPKCPFHGRLDSQPNIGSIGLFSSEYVNTNDLDLMMSADICPLCFRTSVFRDLYNIVINRVFFLPDIISNDFRVVDDEVIKGLIPGVNPSVSSLIKEDILNSFNPEDSQYTGYLYRPEDVVYDDASRSYFHIITEFVVYRIATIFFRYRRIISSIVEMSNTDFEDWVLNHEPDLGLVGPPNIVDGKTEIERYADFVDYLRLLRLDSNIITFNDQIEQWISVLTHTQHVENSFEVVKSIYDSTIPYPPPGVLYHSQYTEAVSFIGRHYNLEQTANNYGLIPNVVYERNDIAFSGVNIVRYQLYSGNIILWTLLQHRIIDTYNRFLNSIMDPRDITADQTLRLSDFINFVKTPKSKNRLDEIRKSMLSRNLTPDLYNEIYNVLISSVKERYLNSTRTIDFYRSKETAEYDFGETIINEFRSSISTSLINYCRQLMIYYNMLLDRYQKMKFVFNIQTVSLNNEQYYFNFSQMIAEGYMDSIRNKITNMIIIDINQQSSRFIRESFYYPDTSRYYFVDNSTFRNLPQDEATLELVNDYLLFNKDNNFHLSQVFTFNQMNDLMRMLGMRDVKVDVYDDYNGGTENALDYYSKLSTGIRVQFNDQFGKYVSINQSFSLNNYELYTYESKVIFDPVNGFDFVLSMDKIVDDGLFNRVWYYLPTITNILYDYYYSPVSLQSERMQIITDNYFNYDPIRRRTYTKCLATSLLAFFKNKLTHSMIHAHTHTENMRLFETNFHNRYAVPDDPLLVTNDDELTQRIRNEILAWRRLFTAFQYFVGTFEYTNVVTALNEIQTRFFSDQNSLKGAVNAYSDVLDEMVERVSVSFELNPILRKEHLNMTITIEYIKISNSLNDLVHKYREMLYQMLQDTTTIQEEIIKALNLNNLPQLIPEVNNSFEELRQLYVESVDILSSLDLSVNVAEVKSKLNLIETREQLEEILFKTVRNVESQIPSINFRFGLLMTSIIAQIQEIGFLFISTTNDRRKFTPSDLFNYINLRTLDNFSMLHDVYYLILIEIIRFITPDDITVQTYLTYTSGKANFYNLTGINVDELNINNIFSSSIDFDSRVDAFNALILNTNLSITAVLHPMSQIAFLPRYIDPNSEKVDEYFRYDLDKIILNPDSDSTYLSINERSYAETKQKILDRKVKTKEGIVEVKTRGIRQKNIKQLKSMYPTKSIRLNSENPQDNNDEKQTIIQTYYMSDIYVQILKILTQKLPNHAWVRYLGFRMIEEVALIIDGEQIDALDGDLMLLLHKLNSTIEHQRGDNIMLGHVPEMYEISNTTKPTMRLYIKFPMFFGKDWGNSLPLISMLHSDVQIKLKLRDANDLLYLERGAELVKPIKIKSQLLGNFIYLSDDERLRCATTKTESIIERHMATGTFIRDLTSLDKNVLADFGRVDNVIKLKYHFEDPCKFLVWKIQIDYPDKDESDKIFWDLSNYRVRNIQTSSVLSDSQFAQGVISADSKIIETVNRILIDFNGKTREQWKDYTYYQLLQPYNRCVNGLDSGEGLYTMCLFPKLLQPSGASNLSKVDDVNFYLELNEQIVSLMKSSGVKLKISMWECSYNIFVAMSGFGALRFYASR